MMMSKSTTAVALLCLILSAAVLTQAARPVPTTQRDQAIDELQVDDVGTESCEGLAEEECLMRRTLAAHVDYIYTQDKPKN